MLFYAWQAWEANALRIVQDTSLASFSAKWLGGKQITKALCDYPGYKPGSRDDKKLLADLWTLLDEAEIVVAHNAIKFDVKKMNARFMANGMKPTSPYRVVDTLRAAKKVASFDRNNLNELSRIFGTGSKVKTGGADLWFDCLAGDEKAWKRMKRYNAQDVKLLEDLYLRLRPWISNHPSVFAGEESCPKCGSQNLQSRGTARSATRSYRRFQCNDCGGWAKGTKSISANKITNAA